MAFKLPKFEDLNVTQKTIIYSLSSKNVKKLAVIGGPGTGKTIIGTQAAALMAESGKKCLFLSYSTMLRDFITNIANDFNINIDNIEIDSYFRWLYNKLIEFGYDADTIFNRLQDRPYTYNLSKLNNVLMMIPENKRKVYDYIFVDEAQDLQDGLVKQLLLFGDKILVTFDDSQKVGFEDSDVSYDHSNLLIDLGLGDKFFDLIENYRNTIQTETIARLLFSSYDINDTTLSKVTTDKNGPQPKLIHYNDIEKAFDYIIDNYDHSRSNAILFDNACGRQVFDSFKAILEVKCRENNIPLFYKFGRYKNINESNSLSNGIFLISDKVSKGLEFDEIYILPGKIDISNYLGRNRLYVSFTRSKYCSSVLLNKEDVTSDIYDLFMSNSCLFKNVEAK